MIGQEKAAEWCSRMNSNGASQLSGPRNLLSIHSAYRWGYINRLLPVSNVDRLQPYQGGERHLYALAGWYRCILIPTSAGVWACPVLVVLRRRAAVRPRWLVVFWPCESCIDMRCEGVHRLVVLCPYRSWLALRANIRSVVIAEWLATRLAWRQQTRVFVLPTRVSNTLMGNYINILFV